MRFIKKILLAVFLVSIPAIAQAETCRIFDKDCNVQGYVRKGAFANQYCIYDKHWNVKGYIRWNSFSERYEIYDKDWSKRGYLKSDEGVLPFLKGAND